MRPVTPRPDPGDVLVPSAPMETSFTPLLEMNSKALFTLAILWKRIFPRSGLGNRSPEGAENKGGVEALPEGRGGPDPQLT